MDWRAPGMVWMYLNSVLAGRRQHPSTTKACVGIHTMYVTTMQRGRYNVARRSSPGRYALPVKSRTNTWNCMGTMIKYIRHIIIIIFFYLLYIFITYNVYRYTVCTHTRTCVGEINFPGKRVKLWSLEIEKIIIMIII